MTTVPNRRIPYWLKVAYSAFVAILVPSYWVTYSPWNFLYFCDVALLITAVTMWIENPLLISMQAVAITVPQMVWVVDLLFRVVAGVEITGVTSYMLDSSIPLFLRGLSLFHGWLPFVLLWLLARLGYDSRALGLQTAAAIVILLVSYLFAPAPPPSASHPTWAEHQLRVRTQRQTAPDFCSTLAVGAVANGRERDCVLLTEPLRVSAGL